MFSTIAGCVVSIIAAALYWYGTYSADDHTPAASFGRRTTAIVAVVSIVFMILQWLRMYGGMR